MLPYLINLNRFKNNANIRISKFEDTVNITFLKNGICEDMIDIPYSFANTTDYISVDYDKLILLESWSKSEVHN